MDPTTNLNNTGNVPATQNPQDTANPGASNAEDFQSTAPSDALNQETDSLNVERTGEAITDAPAPVTSSSISGAWLSGIVLIVVVIVVALYFLLKEEITAFTPEPPAEPAAKKAAPAATKAKAVTKPAKKTTRSGKKKTIAKKKGKKSSKKR